MDGDLNLNDPDDFAKALSKEVPRPFTFGPIKFEDLNAGKDDFDVDSKLRTIIDCLDEHMA